MPRNLTGRFEVQSVIPVDSNTWDVTGNFIDEVGMYGPGDVQIGNALFLYAPVEGVIRYLIVNVTGSMNPITLRVNYDDEGAPVEPPANNGALCAMTNIGYGSLPEEPSFQQQLLDEPLVAGIRSQTNRTQINTNRTIDVFLAHTGGVLQGRVGRKVTSMTIGHADSTSQENATAVGIISATTAESEKVRVIKHGIVPSGIITASCFVENALPADRSWIFLASESGAGQMTVTPPLEGSNLWSLLVGFWENGKLDLHLNLWGKA